LNVAVAYGYEDAGKTLLLRDYMKGDRETTLTTRELGFLLIFLGEHLEPLPSREALVHALRLAVHNWRRGVGHDGHAPADYSYGEAALALWDADLKRADTLNEDQRKKVFFLSWLNLNTVADARKTAVSFLRDHGHHLTGPGAEALERAASRYCEENAMLGDIFAKKAAFLGPWTHKGYEDWSPRVRVREREVLAEIAKMERAAVEAIEIALTAPD